MRAYEQFCGLRVLAFCVMSNHFHLLLEVPAVPEERGADWSDERLLEHLSGLYSKQQMGALRWELEHYRDQKNTEAAEAFRERYFRRMWDLSQFMKPLKQRFTSWFNRKHGRKGTLWEERFKSVLVEDGHAARTMAAYIDLNPVRGGMVDDPKDYRWCSYAEAVAGKIRSREGLQRVMYEHDAAVMSGEFAVEKLINWRSAAYHYRQILYMAVNRNDANLDPGDAPQLTEADALLCRMRELIDGVALGTGPFIENISHHRNHPRSQTPLVRFPRQREVNRRTRHQRCHIVDPFCPISHSWRTHEPAEPRRPQYGVTSGPLRSREWRPLPPPTATVSCRSVTPRISSARDERWILLKAGVDLVNTDHLQELAEFMKRQPEK